MDFLLKTSEIILKGKNRQFFERILINNLKFKLGDLNFIKNLGGVFWIKTNNNPNNLQQIFGIKNVLPVKVFETFEDLLSELKLDPSQKDFKVIVKRGDKSYPLTSVEISNQVKKIIKEKYNLNFNPKSENNIFIEYRDKKFFLADKKIKGWDGLPVSSSGKGLALISAGFDSPVASFLAMKRGLKLYFIHFYSYPQTTKESLEKVKKLIGELNKYNLGTEAYFMNILELQKFYYQNVPKQLLVIFYRRSMFRLANELAKKLKVDSIITGESLGQVASQTIQNMKVINYGLDIFIMRPLLGFDKQEIIDLAKKIGTYDFSLLKGDDCCSLFLPKKVETRAKLDKVLTIEDNLKKEINNFEKKIIFTAETFQFK